MAFTRVRLGGLVGLLTGSFILYTAIESLLLIEDTHLTINRIRLLLGIGIVMIGYGIWKLYSNKLRESKKELMVIGVLWAILAILIRVGIN